MASAGVALSTKHHCNLLFMTEIVGSAEELTNIEEALQDAKATLKAGYGCILNNDTC